MLTMWESSQDHGFSCFPWESANNSSLWKPIHNCFPWRSFFNSLFLLKKALHFLHFLTITRREWRENVYFVDERRKGWHGNSFPHTLLHSVLQNIKKILLGRAIHIVYLNDNSVRPDPYLTDTPWKSLRQVLVALWSESKGFWFKIKQHNNEENLLNKQGNKISRSMSSSIASYTFSWLKSSSIQSWK